MITLLGKLDAIMNEMRTVFAKMGSEAVPQLATEILSARRVLVYGVGRNGLMLQAFAMRLMHLAIDAHFIGQLTTPSVGRGDLFIAASALGRLPSADAYISAAKNAGLRTAVITARPGDAVPCDFIVHLPAQTMGDAQTSLLPLGSPFELALHVFLELTVLQLMDRLGRTNDDLASRHANIL